MNDNKLTTVDTTKHYSITDSINAVNSMNPIVAATGIITLGVFGSILIIASAKYGRDIEIEYKDFNLHIHFSNSALKEVPA